MTDANKQAKTDATNQTVAGAGDLAGKARQFAKDRPYATAALLGVVGMAVLNTLRGKGRGV